MTEKLFWRDSYQKEFTATVLDQFSLAGGTAVVLDRTCFYATSGGQPNDLGTLEGRAVTDVRMEGGRLCHVLAGPLQATSVTGKIDWGRRFDHMQQHTGQHVLSAAFFRLFHAETSSFHLGEDACTIELSRPDLKEPQMRQAEDAANAVLLSATPVTAFFVHPEQVEKLQLRKQADVADSLRIVRIGDFDMSACSGTHVKNASEVGVVFVYGLEKLSHAVKVTFICGDRVRKKYADDLAVLKSLTRSLTTATGSLPEAVGRLQAQIKELRRENAQMKEGRLKAEALQLILQAEEWNDNHLLVAAWDRPYQEVRYLAQRLTEQPGVLGAFICIPESRAIFFKYPGVASDLRPIFKKFLAAAGAKGGGLPHLMEAGSLTLRGDSAQFVRSLFSSD